LGAGSGGRKENIGAVDLMEHVTIAAGIVILLGYAYAYIRRYRSCQEISTTEWVRLMRKNNLRNDPATKARATEIHLL
jgi:hypothetical protein